MQRDMQNDGGKPPDENTIRSYLNALEKIFVVEDMPAWTPCLRSKSAIRTSDTHYFCDPSIAAAAMGVGPGDLMNAIRSLGFFYEALAVRDLRQCRRARRGGQPLPRPQRP